MKIKPSQAAILKKRKRKSYRRCAHCNKKAGWREGTSTEFYGPPYCGDCLLEHLSWLVLPSKLELSRLCAWCATPTGSTRYHLCADCHNLVH